MINFITKEDLNNRLMARLHKIRSMHGHLALHDAPNFKGDRWYAIGQVRDFMFRGKAETDKEAWFDLRLNTPADHAAVQSLLELVCTELSMPYRKLDSYREIADELGS